MRVLVTAATQHGATGEIADAIAGVLRKRGLDVTVMAPAEVDHVEDYDAVVLGSAVYAGHWLGPARDLVERSAAALAARPLWLFSSGPVGDPSRKLVQKMAADPADLVSLRDMTLARDHRMFPGRLDRSHLSRPQRAALRLFPGLEGDYRDWADIERWAVGIANNLEALEPRVGSRVHSR